MAVHIETGFLFCDGGGFCCPMHDDLCQRQESILDPYHCEPVDAGSRLWGSSVPDAHWKGQNRQGGSG